MRPGRSSLLPTWYQMFTATIGALRSVCTITRRPLGSANFSYGMSTDGSGAGFGAAANAVRGRRLQYEAGDETQGFHGESFSCPDDEC